MSSIVKFIKDHWLINLSVIIGVIIIVLVVVYYKKSHESFKKCICSSRQGGCAENCQDTEDVDNAYVSGKATEFSDLKSPGWDRGPNPGSYRFPSSCSGAPYDEHPNFGPWDFTEFGNR